MGSLPLPRLTKVSGSRPQGAKLEVESVIRETCDRILSEPNVSTAELRKRAVALEILGEVYGAVLKDEHSNPPLGGPPGSAPPSATAAGGKSQAPGAGYTPYKGAASRPQ